MSISGAISNALSGLRANSRAATIVSSNISNALTEGYGRRELVRSADGNATLGGVSISGVVRHYDQVLLSDRWLSDARAGFSDTKRAFAQRIETATGDMQSPTSLAARLAAFESAMTLAAGNPASLQRLSGVALAASDLTETMAGLTSDIQENRTRADTAIATGVERLNTSLSRVETLNDAISEAMLRGGDVSSMLDHRQRAIDEIAELVPVRVAQRDNGKVALYTTTGALLLDGPAGEVGFLRTPFVSAGQTLAGGQLSGLTLNDKPISSGPGGPLSGGTLGAHFEVRDVEGVALQAELDALARDLAERFASGGPDTTLAPGAPGLFTDAGAALGATPPPGLAGRISVNALVAPGSTELWRLRDGLGAATEGEVGDASLLVAYGAALNAARVPSDPSLGASANSLSGFVNTFTSSVSGTRLRADTAASFENARNIALRELEFAVGVDTDSELQTLLQIEQNYAANAQILTAADEMMQSILAI